MMANRRHLDKQNRGWEMKTKLTMLCTLVVALAAPAGLHAATTDARGSEAATKKIKRVLVKKKKVMVKKKVVAPRRVRRYVPSHRRKVVHRKVVVHRPVHVVPVRQTVVHRRARRTVVREPHNDYLLGVSLRAVGATIQGEMLNMAAVENPTMWGFGLQFRGKVAEHWGLEFGLDWMRGDGGDVVQTTVPLMLSAYYQFFPHSRFRPHILAGVGALFTKLEYDTGFRYDTVQLAGQLGGGLELRLADWFGLTADVRLLGLYKNLGTQSSIERECIQSHGGKSGYCPGLQTLDTSDQWNIGTQFMAGATIYF